MGGPLSLVYPVMAQVLITFILILWTGRLRVLALRTGRIRVEDIALSNTAWPDDVRKVSNNMNNQFETPVLFFALCGIATYIGATSFLMVILAWLYVLGRLAHASIHVTSNYVPRRGLVFGAGVLILIAMWIVIALQLAFA